MNRFSRHIQLPEFGESSQIKLAKSRVLVIGAGGLGCPVLQQLVAMGVGHIGIADGDTVEIHNLHRQILYNEGDVGRMKVEAAAQKLLAMHSDVQVKTYPYFMDSKHIFPVINAYDMIVDGTDRIHTRYLINDACRVSKKPWVYGAVYQYEGQVAVFNTEINGHLSADYRDLFPDPSKNPGGLSCDTVGVLGLVPNFIGMLMANEVVKWITGTGKLLSNQLLHYNLWSNQQIVLNVATRKDIFRMDDRQSIENTHYESLCKNIAIAVDKRWVEVWKNNPRAVLVDVRQSEEQPKLNNIPHLSIPLPDLEQKAGSLSGFDDVIFVCQSGIRSRQAMDWAKNNLAEKAVYHIRGGIQELMENVNHA